MKWCPFWQSLLQNSTFCSCEKSKRISNGVRFDKPDIIAEFYFCCENQNRHHMVPVLTSPTLLQNSTFVVIM